MLIEIHYNTKKSGDTGGIKYTLESILKLN